MGTPPGVVPANAPIRLLETPALGVPLLLTGQPGQGKSWVCEQVVEALTSAGWLVAEHYCYLADMVDERDERVQAETVFGSLLARLADAVPTSTGERAAGSVRGRAAMRVTPHLWIDEADEAPGVVLEVWRAAPNRSRCAPLAPTNEGAEPGGDGPEPCLQSDPCDVYAAAEEADCVDECKRETLTYQGKWSASYTSSSPGRSTAFTYPSDEPRPDKSQL